MTTSGYYVLYWPAGTNMANNVSQPVFASYLNISESTVQKWETGAKHPNGAALRLLSLVDQHGLAIFETA